MCAVKNRKRSELLSLRNHNTKPQRDDEHQANVLQIKWKKEYYERQDRLLQLYEQDQELNKPKPQTPPEDDQEDQRLLNYCLALTIFSLFGNLLASILSGSLSILSTFVDALMDLMCSAVMNTCLRLIEKSDTVEYPRGRHRDGPKNIVRGRTKTFTDKEACVGYELRNFLDAFLLFIGLVSREFSRLEYVGIMMCANLMAFANIFMAMQAYNSIEDGSSKPELTLPTTLIVGTQTILKALLSWICYRRGSPSSIVIAMDLRNDVVTRLSAVVFAFIGDRYWRLADPIGAIAICTMIALSWFYHALEHIPQLVGRRAKQEQLSRILKLAIDHDPNIKCLDHVMVYHTGEKAFVEMHVVMDEGLPLKITHDVCDSLEKKLKRLDFVERAFIHCDYYCDGD